MIGDESLSDGVLGIAACFASDTRVAPPFLLWLLVPLVFLPGCAPEKTLGEDVGLYQLTHSPRQMQRQFGEGLNGRIVDGKKIYTVEVIMRVSEEGKVVHAEVNRSDAPERLQWATVRAVRKFRYPASRRPAVFIQSFIYHDLDVKPG